MLLLKGVAVTKSKASSANALTFITIVAPVLLALFVFVGLLAVGDFELPAFIAGLLSGVALLTYLLGLRHVDSNRLEAAIRRVISDIESSRARLVGWARERKQARRHMLAARRFAATQTPEINVIAGSSTATELGSQPSDRALVGAEIPWRELRGIPWENYIAQCIKRLGGAVEMTPRTRDFGVDVIVNYAGKRIAIQAKGQTGNVGVGAVQEVVSGAKRYDCTIIAVVTNSLFTPAAEELAETHGCHMVSQNNFEQFRSGDWRCW